MLMQKLVILHLLLILIIVFLYDSKSLNLFSLGNVAYKKMYIKQMYILKDSNYKNTWFKIKVYLPFDVSLCPSWYLCTHSQTPKCNHFSTFFDNHHLVCLYRFTMLICTLKYMSQIGLFRVQRLFKWLAWAFSQHGNEIQKRNIPKEKIPVCMCLSSLVCLMLAGALLANPRVSGTHYFTSTWIPGSVIRWESTRQ